MDIDVPLRDLGEVASQALIERVLGFDDRTWHENAYRQNQYDVHSSTESVVMTFTDGSGWPNIKVTKESGWDLMADVAQPLMDDILAKYYPPGGKIIRAMAAKLLPGGVIKPHVDKHPSFHVGHRIHIPITTNSRVRFMIGGKPYRFTVGHAYEINNQMQHSVMNKGKEGRITFIFDYVPPDQLHKVEITDAA